MRTAIILATHGSRRPEFQRSLQTILARVQQLWSDSACTIAFTSEHILHNLQKHEQIYSVSQTLDMLHAQGYRHIVLQSLHIIPGKEFSNLLTLAKRLMLKDKRFEHIEVGMPLLASNADVEKVADTLVKLLPLGINTTKTEQNEATIFLGHGTPHAGNKYYAKLNQCLQKRNPLVFLGVMGSAQNSPAREPSVASIHQKLIKTQVTKTLLLPFLFGAGYHAANDIMSDAPHSWKSQLTALGFSCRGLSKPFGEYEELADIWLAHLEDAMKKLAKT